MGFNLEDYQTVAERLDIAHKEYLNLRVVTSLIHIERNKEGMPIQYVCKAEIWIGDLLKATMSPSSFDPDNRKRSAVTPRERNHLRTPISNAEPLRPLGFAITSPTLIS